VTKLGYDSLPENWSLTLTFLPDMITPEELVGEEWAEWYSLTPLERWLESEKLWRTYQYLGGSLDPEPDTQSPFFDPASPCESPADGRSGLRVVRRSGV